MIVSWKKIIRIQIFGIVCCLFSFGNEAFAQMISKDTLIKGTKLSFQMDKRVDELLQNMRNNCSKSNMEVITPEEDVSLADIAIESGISEFERISSKSEVCKKYPKLNGYKIQAITLNNSEKAQETLREVRNTFPDLRVELDSQFRPQYRILVGSFFSQEGATEDLKRVKSFFPNAVIVPYRIFCIETK